MTESQWLESTDPNEMLAFLRSNRKLPERKLLLFAIACCNSILHLLTDQRSRTVLEVVARYADGQAALEEVGEATSSAWEAARELRELKQGEMKIEALGAAARVGWLTNDDVLLGYQTRVFLAEISFSLGINVSESQCALLRDFFGPLPFRQIHLEAPLLTAQGGIVVKLAQTTYQHLSLPSGILDPERLSILADAVEEGGGADEVVAHLRSQQPHTRGCWVIDLLTGKS